MKRAVVSGSVYTLLLISFRANCHFNLPLSVCLCFMQLISKHRLFMHCVCQFAGCFTACILLSWISSSHHDNEAFVAPVAVAHELSFVDVIIVEVVATFVFVFAGVFCFTENSGDSKEDGQINASSSTDELLCENPSKHSPAKQFTKSLSNNSLPHCILASSTTALNSFPPLTYRPNEAIIAGVTLTAVSLFAVCRFYAKGLTSSLVQNSPSLRSPSRVLV